MFPRPFRPSATDDCLFRGGKHCFGKADGISRSPAVAVDVDQVGRMREGRRFILIFKHSVVVHDAQPHQPGPGRCSGDSDAVEPATSRRTRAGGAMIARRGIAVIGDKIVTPGGQDIRRQILVADLQAVIDNGDYFIRGAPAVVPGRKDIDIIPGNAAQHSPIIEVPLILEQGIVGVGLERPGG